MVETYVVERSTPEILDLEVRGSSLARRVVSLDKELFSIHFNLSLFTQVYKWVPVTYHLGSPTMDFRSDHGGAAILLGMLDAKVIRYKLQPFGPLVHVRLYLYSSLMKFVLNLQNSTGAFCV